MESGRGREEEGRREEGAWRPFFLAFLPFLAALALLPRRSITLSLLVSSFWQRSVRKCSTVPTRVSIQPIRCSLCGSGTDWVLKTLLVWTENEEGGSKYSARAQDGHRMWKETKQEPGTAEPGNMLCCCLVSFHFLWAILSTSIVPPALYDSYLIPKRIFLY